MAENELKLHVSADTQSARDEFKQLGTEAQKAFNGLGEQGQIAAQRLAALDKAWDSPAKLGKAASLAKLELEELAGAIEKAGKMTPDLAKQFDVASQKIDLAAGRARQFADVAGDMKDRGDAAAKGFEALAGSAGSLEGMLGQLGASGGKTGDALSKLGFAGMGISSAFALGYSAGKQLDEMLQGVGVRTDKFREGVASATVALLTHVGVLKDAVPKYEAFTAGQAKAGEAALAAAEKVAKARAIIAAGTGQEWVFGEKAVEDVVAMGNAFEELLRKREKLGQFESEVRGNYKAILQWRDSIIDLGGSLDTLPPYQQKIIAEAERVAREIRKVAEDFEYTQKVAETFGKNTTHEILSVGESTKVMSGVVVTATGETQKSFTNMAAAIDSVGEGAVTGGADLDGYGLHIENIGQKADEARARLDALDIQMGKTGANPEASRMGGTLSENVDALNREAAALGELMALREKAHQARIAQMDAEAERDRDAHEAHMQRLDDAQRAVDAAQQLQQAEEGTIKFQGQVKVLMLELTEATEAQIDALRRMGGAMTEVADGASKLTDYLANLLDGFRSGATSAFTTIEQLSTVIRQLEDLLSKNMGTKFEADIRKMLDAYKELRDELRMGGVEKEQALRI